MSGWYRKYKGRSTGRVCHFVEFYCGLHIAERVVVGNGELFYPTERDLFAKFTWVPGDIPVFYFMPYDIRQTHLHFAANQVARLQEALQCSEDIPYPTQETMSTHNAVETAIGLSKEPGTWEALAGNGSGQAG